MKLSICLVLAAVATTSTYALFEDNSILDEDTGLLGLHLGLGGVGDDSGLLRIGLGVL